MKYMNELKLDFEQENPQKRLSIYRVAFVAKILRLVVKDVKAWRTTNGIHIRIKTEQQLHPVSCVLIQSLMGSDYARETYNTIRVFNLIKGKNKNAQELWNVLFYKKLLKGEVVSEEEYDEKMTEKLVKKLCG